MYDLAAYATREEGVIQVALFASLESSCWAAEVKDKYPGGSISYYIDPGEAQVFIEEKMTPGSEVCLLRLVPWAAQVSIPTTEYSQVAIYVNGVFKLRVDIKGQPVDYRVVAWASLDGGPRGCSVIPADSPIYPVWATVFGPASKEECEEWRLQNCVREGGSSDILNRIMPQTAESGILVDFSEADVVPGFVNDTYILIVKGEKPYINMEVRLVPKRVDVLPEYWDIEVVGTLPGIGLPATEPYSVFIPLDSIRGTKGVKVIGSNKESSIDV